MQAIAQHFVDTHADRYIGMQDSRPKLIGRHVTDGWSSVTIPLHSYIDPESEDRFIDIYDIRSLLSQRLIDITRITVVIDSSTESIPEAAIVVFGYLSTARVPIEGSITIDILDGFVGYPIAAILEPELLRLQIICTETIILRGIILFGRNKKVTRRDPYAPDFGQSGRLINYRCKQKHYKPLGNGYPHLHMSVRDRWVCVNQLAICRYKMDRQKYFCWIKWSA